MPRIEIERIEEVLDLAESSTERFDRIAFAARAIALIRPPQTTVAICRGSSRVHVESGRQWGAPVGARWAVVHVPPDASRRAIARAVLGLYPGKVDGCGPYRGAAASPPAWTLDVLVSELHRHA